MTTIFAKPADLLPHLLGGATLTIEELRQFVRQHTKESNFHEFKPGSWAATTHAELVKQWVTSFCNADGGVLLVGVTEGPEVSGGGRGPRVVEGARTVGSQSLTSWATNVLQKYVGRMVPGPRISEVAVDDEHSVLCIAVDRAPTLVACKGDEYWMRTGDSTVAVASYLLSDLILGRRRHPVFRVASASLRIDKPILLYTGEQAFELVWSVTLENRSLVWADPIRVGVITYSLANGSAVVEQEDELLRFVNVEPATLHVPYPEQLKLSHYQNTRHDIDRFKLEPFEKRPLGSLATSRAWLPPLEGRTSREAKLCAALYVLPRDSQPSWFQLECSFSYQHLSKSQKPPEVQATACASGGRPVISLDLVF